MTCGKSGEILVEWSLFVGGRTDNMDIDPEGWAGECQEGRDF